MDKKLAFALIGALLAVGCTVLPDLVPMPAHYAGRFVSGISPARAALLPAFPADLSGFKVLVSQIESTEAAAYCSGRSLAGALSYWYWTGLSTFYAWHWFARRGQ